MAVYMRSVPNLHGCCKGFSTTSVLGILRHMGRVFSMFKLVQSGTRLGGKVRQMRQYIWGIETVSHFAYFDNFAGLFVQNQ